jgi:aldehyde dehydrogenase (NAD+)
MIRIYWIRRGIFSRVASAEDVDLAVAAARQAFKTTWGKNVTGVDRSKLIHRLADLIERDAEELAEIESTNNGKPVKFARFAYLTVLISSLN